MLTHHRHRTGSKFILETDDLVVRGVSLSMITHPRMLCFTRSVECVPIQEQWLSKEKKKKSKTLIED